MRNKIEEKYRSLFEFAPMAIFHFDANGNFLAVNNKAIELTGFSSDEFRSLNISAIFDTSGPQNNPQDLDLLNRGVTIVRESEIRTKYINRIRVETNTKAIPDGTYQCFVTDITGRSQMEAALRESENKLEMFFTQSLDGFFFMMLDEPIEWNDTVDKEKTLDYVFAHQRFTKVNDAILKQYNATREQYLNLTPNDLYIHHLDSGRQVWREFFDKGKLHIETKERRLDGSLMIVEGDYICLYDEHKRITGHFGIQRDITERKLAEEALRSSENKYRVHIQQTPLATIEYDKKFLLTSWNPAAEKIFGYSAEEAIGKHTNLIVPENDVPQVSHIIKKVVEQGITTKNINENRTKSGEIILCEWYNSPLVDTDGTISGMAAFAIDITERKQAEKALKESEAQLRELNATKDKFFSIIAHDLKTPFNAIIGFSELLVVQVKNKDYDEAEKYAEIIQHSSQRAMELLRNLLEWSRSQTGRMEYHPEQVNLVQIINDTLTLLRDCSEQKTISIFRKLPDHIQVFADKDMISTILRNLISNAIKFTSPCGDIVLAAEQKQDELIISVKDTGIGIKKEDLEKLFRIDVSHSTTGTLNEKGTGLGLILCKDFVEKHKGRIWAESEPGVGSTFYFTIPKA
jgi:PAS domain S-box-containing protein